MKIVSAEFVVSAAAPAQFPHPVLPEVAFAGKSNVGKSSLINSLLHRKKLVKTSARPGKTQLINFFLVNERFHAVDLPGYGFAKAPKAVQAGWAKLVEAYLAGRQGLRGLVLIVDIRHDPGALDLQMKAWLDGLGRSYLVVANKADQVSSNQLHARLRRIGQAMSLAEPPLAYSAKTDLGRDALWSRLQRWLGSAE
jgi:GTP-binding protein